MMRMLGRTESPSSARANSAAPRSTPPVQATSSINRYSKRLLIGEIPYWSESLLPTRAPVDEAVLPWFGFIAMQFHFTVETMKLPTRYMQQDGWCLTIKHFARVRKD